MMMKTVRWGIVASQLGLLLSVSQIYSIVFKQCWVAS